MAGDAILLSAAFICAFYYVFDWELWSVAKRLVSSLLPWGLFLVGCVFKGWISVVFSEKF